MHGENWIHGAFFLNNDKMVVNTGYLILLQISFFFGFLEKGKYKEHLITLSCVNMSKRSHNGDSCQCNHIIKVMIADRLVQSSFSFI